MLHNYYKLLNTIKYYERVDKIKSYIHNSLQNEKKRTKSNFFSSEKDTQLSFLVGHFVSKVIVYFICL